MIPDLKAALNANIPHNNFDPNNNVAHNVITKPLEIYDAIVQCSKTARAAFIESLRGVKRAQKVLLPLKIAYLVQDNKLIVSFTPPRVNPMEFTCGVLEKEFLEELGKFFLFDSTCCGGGDYCRAFCPPQDHQKERQPFNVGSVSVIEQPLKGWKKFHRVMYERLHNENCTDVITRYLREPLLHSDLMHHLFLLPSQIDNNATAKDLLYFQQLHSRCVKLSPEDRQIVSSQFQVSYPMISQRIFADLVQENLEKHKAESTNDYALLLEALNSQVYGQPKATQALAGVLSSQKNSDKCLAFIFVGPSGVGKTELAKAVTKHKVNGSVSMRMNQYQMETDVTKFFGSSSGFVGSTDEPHFMKELMKCNPVLKKDSPDHKEYEVHEVVILLDELEKAHSKVKQSLLTVIDEGFYSASYTSGSANTKKTFHLKKCVIIGTSNLFKDQIFQAFQRNYTHQEIITLINNLNNSRPSAETFSTEFLGRFSIVPFGPIPKGDVFQNLLKSKLNIFFAELKKNYQFRQVLMENEPRLLLNLENRLHGDGTQIRDVSRYFDKISNEFIQQHKHAWGDLKDVKLVFHIVEDQLFIKVIKFVPGFDIEFVPPIADLRVAESRPT